MYLHQCLFLLKYVKKQIVALTKVQYRAGAVITPDVNFFLKPSTKLGNLPQGFYLFPTVAIK